MKSRPLLSIYEAAFAVSVMFVTTVDDDIAGFEQRNQLIDQIIDGLASLDHNHDLARASDAFDEFFERVTADKLFCRRRDL